MTKYDARVARARASNMCKSQSLGALPARSQQQQQPGAPSAGAAAACGGGSQPKSQAQAPGAAPACAPAAREGVAAAGGAAGERSEAELEEDRAIVCEAAALVHSDRESDEAQAALGAAFVRFDAAARGRLLKGELPTDCPPVAH
eukprot:1711390-Prymnesium_polylepis.2